MISHQLAWRLRLIIKTTEWSQTSDTRPLTLLYNDFVDAKTYGGLMDPKDCNGSRSIITHGPVDVQEVTNCLNISKSIFLNWLFLFLFHASSYKNV